mmetsp:Transcript_16239/g.23122  ORF Transcript_16239/g.23122 Transcript_16239/m.23122 type:complete len:356 (+) Transcript_16239:197-1264(+)
MAINGYYKTRSKEISSTWSKIRNVLNVREIIGFSGWFATFAFLQFLFFSVWVLFFTLLIREESFAASPFQNTLQWICLTTFYVNLRKFVRKAICPDLLNVQEHAEIFAATSLVMIFSVNIASYLHTPTEEPLYDLGYALVPEQDLHSKWRSLSDTMTMALPFLCIVQTLPLSRPERCKLICHFLRLATLCYGLRTFTVALTSLPGPAPHCRLGSNEYDPPKDWIDIVTRLGPAHGKFNTCGDLLYSGHICYVNSALLLYLRQMDARFQNYSRTRWLFGFSYLFTVAILCISGRKHYTIDIVLGIIISTLIFFHFEHSWIPLFIQYEDQYKKSKKEKYEDNFYDVEQGNPKAIVTL